MTSNKKIWGYIVWFVESVFAVILVWALNEYVLHRYLHLTNSHSLLQMSFWFVGVLVFRSLGDLLDKKLFNKYHTGKKGVFYLVAIIFTLLLVEFISSPNVFHWF
jgi:hypothetical protein